MSPRSKATAEETEAKGALTPLDPAEEKVGEAFTPAQAAQIEAGEYPTPAMPAEEGAEAKESLQAEQEERIEGGTQGAALGKE